MKLLRTVWDKLATLIELVILLTAAIAPVVAFGVWVAILPTIGLLWLCGVLK